MKIGLAITPGCQWMLLHPYSIYSFCTMHGHRTCRDSQGQPFDERTLTLVSSIHATYPELEISVDGAVSFENIDDLIEAGVTQLVIDLHSGTQKILEQNCKAFQTHVGIETVEEDDDML